MQILDHAGVRVVDEGEWKVFEVNGERFLFRRVSSALMWAAEFLDKLEYAERHTRSQEAARSKLVALGIHDEAGNLTKEYGGAVREEEG